MTLRIFPIPEKSFFIDHRVINIADLVNLSRGNDLTLLKNNGFVAKSSDLVCIM